MPMTDDERLILLALFDRVFDSEVTNPLTEEEYVQFCELFTRSLEWEEAESFRKLLGNNS